MEQEPLSEQIPENTPADMGEAFRALARRIEIYLTPRKFGEEPADALLAEAHELLLMASNATSGLSLGECRMARPFAPLRPILENGVVEWRCTHVPSHP